MDKIKSVAETTVQTVRNIALLLRPSMLDDLGLIAGPGVARPGGLAPQ